MPPKKVIAVLSLENLNKICRRCLKETNANMYECFYKDQTIASILETITSMPINKDDLLPKMLCLDCIKLLMDCYFFLTKYKQSDSVLKQAVNQLTKNKKIVQNIVTAEHAYASYDDENEVDKSTWPDENEADQSAWLDQNEKDKSTNHDERVSDEFYGKYLSLLDETVNAVEDKTGPEEETIVKYENNLDDKSNDSDCELILTKEEAVFTCEMCSKMFNSSDELLEHKSDCRLTYAQKTFQCNFCNRTLNNQQSLIFHEKQHLGICGYCDKQCSNTIELKQHKNEAHLNKRLKCKYCPQVFRRPELWFQHNLSHNIKENLPTKCKCNVCGSEYDSLSTLEEHLQTAHTRLDHICETCGETYKTLNKLKIHQKIHHRDTYEETVGKRMRKKFLPKECDICHLSFVAVEQHKYNKHGVGNPAFECTDCIKKFLTKAQLSHHTRKVHTGLRPYQCKFCKKSFFTGSSLLLHSLVHNKRKYKCDLCDKKFVQTAHLKEHMKVHNNIKNEICPYCDKAFSFRGNLRVHIRTHTGETPYVCDICQKGYIDSTGLKRHRLKHFNQQ